MSVSFVNPPELPQAVGFSHLAITGGGKTLYLAGQAGHRPDGTMAAGLEDQFAQACRNVLTALEAGGAGPADLVWLHIYVTDMPTYREHRRRLGEVYRGILGRHYPPMALLAVTELYDPAAMVELVGIAVLP